MKLSDYDEVTELVKTLNRINSAIKELERNRKRGDNSDYWGNLSLLLSESGEIVDLRGCYVLCEVMKATENILYRKRLEILSSLEGYGVDTENGHVLEN